MPVHNDFEERFVSRLFGLCSWDRDANDPRGDPGGWGGNGGYSPGGSNGGGHQGNGGEGNNSYNRQARDRDRIRNAGNPGAPASKPSVTGNKGNKSGTSSPPDDGTRGGQSPNRPTQQQCLSACTTKIVQEEAAAAAAEKAREVGIPTVDKLFKNAQKAIQKLKRGAGIGEVFDAADDILNKTKTTHQCVDECRQGTGPIAESISRRMTAPALPDHPSITKTGYSVVGYNRLRTHRDGEDYRINAFSKVTGYNVPAGKELIQFYNKVYIIPDAATRRRMYD